MFRVMVRAGAVSLMTLSTPIEDAGAATPRGAERQVILDAARAPVAARLGRAVRFKPQRLERRGDWAFLLAAMQDERGRPLSYEGTPLAEAERMGMLSKDCAILLRNRGGRWTVVDSAVGPTDVAWEDWAAKHGAPATLFP